MVVIRIVTHMPKTPMEPKLRFDNLSVRQRYQYAGAEGGI